MIRKLQPALVFLDIQMPVRLGFELLEALDGVLRVIFVTAFYQYALQDFEYNAFDHLLKPFREERFDKTIRKFLNTRQIGGQDVKTLFLREG